MADEPKTGEMPTGQPAGDTANQPPAGESQQAATGDAKQELELMRAALKKANAEAAERRKKLDAYEKAEADRKAADLSEVERAKKALADAQEAAKKMQAELSESRIKAAIEMEAVKMGFYDAADARALVDMSAVEIDEAGKVKGAADALKALAKARPYLLKPAQTAQSDTDASKRGKGESGMSEDEVREFAAIYGLRPEYVKQAMTKK